MSGLIKKYLKLLFILFSGINLLLAQGNSETITKRGTTSAQFLKIGVDARGTAMGNAFTAMDGDVSNIYWNPAGLASVSGMQVLFVNTPWIADIHYNFAGFTFQVPGIGVMGFSLTSLNVPDDIVRTAEDPEGSGEKFDAGGLAVTTTFARSLTDRFSIGFNLKYIQEKIWHSSARAVAGDLGALFVTPFNDIRIGASLSNFGNDMKMNGRDLIISVDPDPNNQGNVEFVNALYETDGFPLPLLFRVGIAGELVKNNNTRISFGLDALHPNDNSESVNIGLECAYRESYFIRSGYTTLFQEDSEQGLTIGGGLNYRLGTSKSKIKIDYSFADYGRLGSVQRLTIGLRL